MEVSIAHGVGYRLADKNKTSDSNFIPIDSIFSPIVKSKLFCFTYTGWSSN